MATAPANTMSAAQAAAQALALNLNNRELTLPGRRGSTSRLRRQNIFSQTFTNYVAGQSLQINVAPAPVGILTRFIVRITANAGIGAAEVQTKTAIGPSALLSQVLYIDTSNVTRVNTTGRHLTQLAAHRRRSVYGGARITDAASVIGMGANYTAGLMASPATLTGAPPANSNVAMYFEVPIAYAPDNLQGAVLSNFVNATQSLVLTINPNFFVSSTDTVNIGNAGYVSSTAQLGTLSAINVSVYQEYIDGYNPATLPMQDLSHLYYINETGGFQPTPNVDLPIAFQNFRSFLSAMIFYNNGGVFNAGSDINYFALRLANSTDLTKDDPYTLSLINREMMQDDFPPGYYWYDFRVNPVLTNAYGNTSLVINPKTVNAGATFNVGWEAIGMGNNVVAAQGLPSGS